MIVPKAWSSPLVSGKPAMGSRKNVECVGFALSFPGGVEPLAISLVGGFAEDRQTIELNEGLRMML